MTFSRSVSPIWMSCPLIVIVAIYMTYPFPQRRRENFEG
jgi:hypothetical protein